jgi:hypothetical protein
MSHEDHDHRSGRESVDRRGALQRFGQWSLGIAATVAGLTVVSARPAAAEIPGDGCCNIHWRRACTGQEWSQGCGRCTSRNDDLGRPDGKWYWSCPEGGRQRFCGECFFRHCHMMFTYSGSPVSC